MLQTSPKNSHPATCSCVRVRLFNLGDKLSDAERKRRLRGQYKRMSQLSAHIYWMDVGEVGYLDFNKRLKQKAVAKQMTAFKGGLMADMSPSKAQKMIAKAIETQEKAVDAAKHTRIARFTNHQRPAKSSSRSPRTRPVKSRSFQSKPPTRNST